MTDGLTPVTNQDVSGSVSNNLLKLAKEHYELQQYSRRNNVEILDLPDIFTGDRLTEKVGELCNDVGIMVEVRDVEACHRLSSIDDLPRISHLNLCGYSKKLWHMFHFLWNVIYFMKNYIILHYALDFKYGDHSLFTGVSVTNYAN